MSFRFFVGILCDFAILGGNNGEMNAIDL